MEKSDYCNKLEDETELPEVDYSNLPDEILKALEPEQYKIEKNAKLSWDGRQFLVRIPSDIANEMEITKDNKNDFKVHFVYTKPAPNTNNKKYLTMDLEWTPQNNE